MRAGMRFAIPAFLACLPWAISAFGEDTLQAPGARITRIHGTGRNADALRPPIRFDTAMLAGTAGTGNDLNRVLAMDVAAQGSGLLSDNALSVRGGRFNENLYILNGMEFPNPNHFSMGSDGALGFISPNILREVEMHAGATRGEFASSAASAVLVRTRSGNPDRFGSTLDLSITGW